MPKVPVLNAPTVGRQALPGARQTILTPRPTDGGGQIIARQNQQLGNAMMGAGGLVGEIAIKLQDEANQVRVLEAQEQALQLVQDFTYDPENGYVNVKGKAVFERQSGKPLSDEYTEKLQESLNNISQGLGNDAQREMFSKFSADTISKFRGSTLEHENRQYQNYKASVFAGTIENRIADTAMNWNNPDAVTDNFLAIGSAATALGRMQGKSAQEINANIRSAQSKALTSAMVAAIDAGDIELANKYFNAAAPNMEPNDAIKIGRALKQENDKSAVKKAVGNAFGRLLPEVYPSDAKRGFNVLLKTESGGQHFDKDGNVIISPAGAVGIAQIMPETGPEAARLAGLEWDEDKFRNDPEYNMALGWAYFSEQLRVNKGDILKAWGAYNGGPGRLKQAIEKAEKDGGEWIDYMPPETQNYVTKNYQDYTAGGGKLYSDSDIRKAVLSDPEIAGNSERERLANIALDAQLKAVREAKKEQQDQALDAVYKTLHANNGDMDSVPAGLMQAVPGDKLSGVMSYAEKVAKGQLKLQVWAEIVSMPAQELAKMSPSEFFAAFSPYLDSTHIEKGYDLIKDAQEVVEQDAKHLRTISIEKRKKNSAIEAGLIPADGKLTEEQAAVFWRYELAVDKGIRELEINQLQGKRPANDEEVQSVIDRVLMDKVNVANTFFDDKDVPLISLTKEQQDRAYVEINNTKVYLHQIPAQERNAIIQMRQDAGLSTTAVDVVRFWLAAQSGTQERPSMPAQMDNLSAQDITQNYLDQ